jgi:hypothetical protein
MAHIQEWGKLAINLPGTHRLARVEKPKLPSCGRITVGLYRNRSTSTRRIETHAVCGAVRIEP